MLIREIPGKIRRKVWKRIGPPSTRLLWGEPRLEVERFSSSEEYRDYCERTKDVRAEETRRERSLIPAGAPPDAFTVTGHCAACRSWTQFQVDWQYMQSDGCTPVPHWRESLHCPTCWLNSRMRASFHLFRDHFRPDLSAAVYMTEQVTSLFARVAARYPATVGSEFLADGTPIGGVNAAGIRHEDLTRLSFDDCRFDYILSFEVLEHVPDYQAALRECARVLKPGGSMLVSVPCHEGERTTTRARIGPAGIEHLLPPEYHGDPLSSDGCLCFYHFGWDFLDALREAGFRETYGCRVASRPLGYFGGHLLFVAKK